MSTLRFRRGTRTDAGALAALAARTFLETFGPDNRPEDMQAHLQEAYGVAQQTAELDNPDIHTVLACQGDVLIAYAQVRRAEAPGCVTHPDPVELHRFYLDKSAHGSGLAAQLLHQVHAAARALGGRHLWLGVWEHNPRAIAFYAKSGFTRVGSHVFMVGSDAQTDWVYCAPVPTAYPSEGSPCSPH